MQLQTKEASVPAGSTVITATSFLFFLSFFFEIARRWKAQLIVILSPLSTSAILEDNEMKLMMSHKNNNNYSIYWFLFGLFIAP